MNQNLSTQSAFSLAALTLLAGTLTVTSPEAAATVINYQAQGAVKWSDDSLNSWASPGTPVSVSFAVDFPEGGQDEANPGYYSGHHPDLASVTYTIGAYTITDPKADVYIFNTPGSYPDTLSIIAEDPNFLIGDLPLKHAEIFIADGTQTAFNDILLTPDKFDPALFDYTVGHVAFGDGYNIQALQVDYDSFGRVDRVPEPATLILLAAGLAGMGLGVSSKKEQAPSLEM